VTLRDDSLFPGGKIYRRRRKHVGETWKPERQRNLDGPGIWCDACRNRHRYGQKKQLGMSFDKRQGVFYIQWYCIKTGNILKEEPLGRK
jgi:hypothetical protein